MGTTAYGGNGSKGRAANGDRPVGAASCRRDITPWRHAKTPHSSPNMAPNKCKLMYLLKLFTR